MVPRLRCQEPLARSGPLILSDLKSTLIVDKVVRLVTSDVGDPRPKFPQFTVIPSPSNEDIVIWRVLSRIHVHTWPASSLLSGSRSGTSSYETGILLLRLSDGVILGGTVFDQNAPAERILWDLNYEPHFFRLAPNDGIVAVFEAFSGSEGEETIVGFFAVIAWSPVSRLGVQSAALGVDKKGAQALFAVRPDGTLWQQSTGPSDGWIRVPAPIGV